MARYQGTIVKNDLPGGGWLLKTAAGVLYQLKNVTIELSDGEQVVVDGEIDEQAMGIAMVGDILDVHSISKRKG